MQHHTKEQRREEEREGEGREGGGEKGGRQQRLVTSLNEKHTCEEKFEASIKKSFLNV